MFRTTSITGLVLLAGLLGSCGRRALEEAEAALDQARSRAEAAELLTEQERERAGALRTELVDLRRVLDSGEAERTKLAADRTRAYELFAELEHDLLRLRSEHRDTEAEVAHLSAELDLRGAALAKAEASLVELTRELESKEEQRLAREREWLDFTRALSSLDLDAVSTEFETDPELTAALEPEPEPEPEPVDEEALRLAARSEEIERTLRTLFKIDGLRGMDLLETGTLGDGWVGPVVFRLVDADGRLSGSLWAERMWLEGSRAARTVTLVLEDGYETWRGDRTDFDRPDPDPRAPSLRRVVLPRVDPEPWLEDVPELFADTPLDLVLDDGIWNGTLVGGHLNELLRQDAAGGYYRLKTLGGIKADVLRAVHLEGYNVDGKLERRLFADRMRIVPQERGVLIQLEDGAQIRGEDKAAFLDGRFRIFLPRANLDEWRARGIPGVAEPDLPGVDASGAASPGDGNAAVDADRAQGG